MGVEQGETGFFEQLSSHVLQVALLLGLGEVEHREVVFGGGQKQGVVGVHELRLAEVLRRVMCEREVEERCHRAESELQVASGVEDGAEPDVQQRVEDGEEDTCRPSPVLDFGLTELDADLLSLLEHQSVVRVQLLGGLAQDEEGDELLPLERVQGG